MGGKNAGVQVTWRITPVSTWLITMAIVSPLRIGLWDPFQITFQIPGWSSEYINVTVSLGLPSQWLCSSHLMVFFEKSDRKQYNNKSGLIYVSYPSLDAVLSFLTMSHQPHIFAQVARTSTKSSTKSWSGTSCTFTGTLPLPFRPPLPFWETDSDLHKIVRTQVLAVNKAVYICLVGIWAYKILMLSCQKSLVLPALNL